LPNGVWLVAEEPVTGKSTGIQVASPVSGKVPQSLLTVLFSAPRIELRARVGTDPAAHYSWAHELGGVDARATFLGLTISGKIVDDVSDSGG
jgi:hypothetical protein